MAKCVEAFGRHSHSRLWLRLGLCRRISEARAPAQTQSTHHYEGKDEDAEKGESSQLLLAQRKQREEEQWMEGENDVKAQGALTFFFFPRCQRKREPLDFFLPSAAFFFLSRPPPVRSFSSRERRARTNNHFFDQRRSWKKNCSLTALSNPLSPF